LWVHGSSYFRGLFASINLAPSLTPPTNLKSRAVHPTPATVPLAPSPSTVTAKPVPTIERHVGALVAAAALVLAQALAERQDGGLTRATRTQGGDAIAALYGLRQFMVADWPFDDIAREHGTAVLRETCGSVIDTRTINILVDEVLDILRKVVRAPVN
jgi:hypothetical protein